MYLHHLHLQFSQCVKKKKERIDNNRSEFETIECFGSVNNINKNFSSKNGNDPN